LRVGWSLATWAAFFAMAFRFALSLGMLGVRWYSVDAGLIQQGQSYSQCNMSAWCDGDDILQAHTSSLMRILKGKMTLQTSYQNDRQKVRICSISRKNDMRETWKKKLWFLEEKRLELIFFVTKWGASRLQYTLTCMHWKIHVARL
jgi:hypothetical protein